MTLHIQPILQGTTDQAREFTRDMQDVLGSLDLLPPVQEIPETCEPSGQVFLVVAQDPDIVQALLTQLTPSQQNRTIVYGQGELDRDTLLHFPIAGLVPDRTISEAHRIQRVPGYQPTQLMLVGQGLYGLKSYFDPNVFEQQPLDILDGQHGLFVLKDDARKFDLALTLRHLIDSMDL